MPRILIFDSSKENAEILAQALRTLLGAVMVSLHNPEDVFTAPIPDDARMAFFTLSSMYDAEAARKFGALHKNIPMVMVSDSSDYGVLSWSLGSCYYLLRPFGENELPRAIHRCAV
jgi:two-component SAPR family response regulator